MALPPVPAVADADRYVLYAPGGVSTPIVDVPFPVYGDGTDLRVYADGNEVGRELWSLVSASGSPLASLSQPITDGRVSFSPAMVAETIEVVGEIHPRQATMPTASGIARREFNQLVGYLLSLSREIWRKNKLFQSQPFGFDKAGPLANRIQYDDKPEGFRFAQTDDAQGRPILYVKLSATTADWSQGMSFRGVQGVPGLDGGGTVTSVASGFGMKGGPITGSGTLSVDCAALNLRNRLLNGAMAIDQRGAGAAKTLAISSGVTNYCLDRWYCYISAAAAGLTAQRVRYAIGGVDYAMRLQRAAASSSVPVVNAVQALETSNIIDLQGRKATLSFRALAGASFSGTGGNLNYAVAYGKGNDQSAASFADGTWTSQAVIATGQISPGAAWGQAVLTVDVPADATQLAVRFYWTPSGTAGAADYVDIIEAMLEPGEVPAANVSFERRPLSFELGLCQRFFQKSYAQGVAPGAVIGDGLGGCIWPGEIVAAQAFAKQTIRFTHPMRAAPSVTIYDNAGAAGKFSYWNTTVWVHNTAITSVDVTDAQFAMQINTGTTVSVNYDFTADAEL